MNKLLLISVITLSIIKTALSSPTPEDLLASDPPKYIIQANGKRLNSFIARDIEILAKAYCETKDKKYLEGVIRYMKAAAAYPDWRAEQHYISASYIVRAFGIALVSCGSEMPEDVRTSLEDALIEKGLKPAENHAFWQSNDNWTQACTLAIAHAAFALKKRFPEMSENYIKRSVESTKSALKAYAPDGCFAEGPSFWKFATEKTDELIALLRERLGDDRGIEASCGYKDSHVWMNAILGPSGRLFNFGDGDSVSHKGEAWRVKDISVRVFNGAQSTGVIAGENFFLAIKGGKANQKHAHMDAGSFVYETVKEGQAIRWVEDLGSERVRRIEHAKIDIDNYAQDSTRWSVFRYGPYSHSAFHIDNKLHLVDGFVPLKASKDEKHSIVADCTSLYDGVWQSAARKFKMGESGILTVEDIFVKLRAKCLYTFNFCTSASVKIEENAVILEKNNRCLRVKTSQKGAWSVKDIAKPKRSFESLNRGMKKVIFTTELNEGDGWVYFSFSE